MSWLALLTGALLGCAPPKTSTPSDTDDPDDTSADTDDTSADSGDSGDSAAALPEPVVASLNPSGTTVVPVTLGDLGERWLLLDTGAPGLHLTAETAALLPGETVDVVFGGQIYANLAWTETDLATASGLLGVALSGLLGHEILGESALALDPRGGRVVPLAAWRDDLDWGEDVAGPFAEVPLTVARRTYLVVDATFEGMDAPVRALLDTGTSSVVVSQTLFEALGADTDGRTLLLGSSAVSGSSTTESTIVRLRGLEVAGEPTEQAWATISSDFGFRSISTAVGEEISAIVGGGFLRERLVVLDHPGGVLRAAPYVDLYHIPAEFQSAGVELIATDDGLVIFTVFIDSDAEAQGVTVGDLLLAIDGEETAAMALDDALSRLRGEVGTTVALSLEGADGPYEVSVLREDLLPLEP